MFARCSIVRKNGIRHDIHIGDMHIKLYIYTRYRYRTYPIIPIHTILQCRDYRSHWIFIGLKVIKKCSVNNEYIWNTDSIVYNAVFSFKNHHRNNKPFKIQILKTPNRIRYIYTYTVRSSSLHNICAA